MPKRKIPVFYVKCLDDVPHPSTVKNGTTFIYTVSANWSHRYAQTLKKYPLITKGHCYKATFFTESPLEYIQLLTTNKGTLSRRFVNGVGKRNMRGVFKRKRFEIIPEGEYLTWLKSKTQ